VYRFLQILIMTAFLITGLVACEKATNTFNVTDNPVVLKKAETLMKAIKDQDYDLAIKQYSKSFFTNKSPEGWRDKLKAYSKDRGPMLSYKLIKRQADTRFSGKFYILEYMAVHEGKKRANHVITMIAPVDSDGIKIIGHKITPWQAGADQ
jgi:hypothetical protein